MSYEVPTHASRLLLNIHPGHPLHPGVYTLTSGNQIKTQLDPRIPLYIHGEYVNEAHLHFRVVSDFDTSGSGVTITAENANHFSNTTDIYPYPLSSTDNSGAQTLAYNTSVTGAGGYEPIGVFTMGNPNRGLWGGDWLCLTVAHSTTSGSFIFDSIRLFTV